MLFYETDFCELRWIEEHNIVHYIWKGFASGEPRRKAADKVLELIELKKSHLFLGDNTNGPTHNKEDEEWLTTVWFPKIKKSTLKKMALISPQKAVQKAIVDRIVRTFDDSGLQSSEFSNYDEAMKWLKSK